MTALSGSTTSRGRTSRRCRGHCGKRFTGRSSISSEEPVPALADPFPEDDPLPGAYRLHLPSDGVSIWYTVTRHEGQEVITIQYVKADT